MALTLDLKADANDILRELSRVRGELGRLDDRMATTSKSGITLGQSIGGLAIGYALSRSISEFEEAEVSARSTAAAIEATGNAAEVSADQQAQLVEELSRMAGVDDEVVNGAANMLRTFTSIKGENFGAALGASLDIAAMKGMDLASAAELIGKALNDPVAGMSKLTRAGVVLSAQQKEQIRDFAAVGDVASAQGVILAELEREYGGQAEAAATASGRMQVAIDDAAESVGESLAPAMTLGANVVGGLADAFGHLPVPVRTAVLALTAAAVIGPRVADGLSRIKSAAASAREGMAGLSAGSTVLSTGGMAAAGALGVLGVAALGYGIEAQRAAERTRDVEEAVARLKAMAEQTGRPLEDVFATDFLVGEFEANPKALETLDYYGVSIAEFRDAALGGDKEWKAFLESLGGGLGSVWAEEAGLTQLRDALNDAKDGMDAGSRAADELGGSLDSNKPDEYADATESATTALDDLVALQQAGVEGVIDYYEAQEAYSDATRNRVDAEAELAEAQRAAAGDSDEYRQALEDITDAREAEADAADDVRRAQEDLNQAYRDAAEALQDKQFAAEGAALSEERAALRLEDARANYRDVMSDPKATAREKKEAQLDLAEAELALREAQDRRQDSTLALQEAEAKGIEGSDQVVSAKENLESALDRQADAERRTRDATDEAAQVIEDAKKRVTDATEKVEDAMWAEGKAFRNAAEKVYGSVAANNLFLGSLRDQQGMLQEGSPYRKALDGLIEDMERYAELTAPKGGVAGGFLPGTVFEKPSGSSGTGNNPWINGPHEPLSPFGSDRMAGGDAGVGVNVTINAPGMVVGGDQRDLEKAAAKAGREAGRRIRAAA